MANDPKSLWKEQPVTVTTYSPDDLRVQLVKQHRMLRTRNLIEYVAGAVVVVFFAVLGVLATDAMTRAGALLVIAGTAVVLWQLHRRASAAPVPAQGDLLAFQRLQLARQHAALRSVPVWYLGPFLPGIAVLCFARFTDLPPEEFWPAVFGTAWVVMTFAVVWLLNHLAARRLARQIEDLDRIGDPR